MLNRILIYLVDAILNWLASRVSSEVKSIVDQKKDDKAFEESNEKNAVKYEQTKIRIEKIKAAESLLNRYRR